MHVTHRKRFISRDLVALAARSPRELAALSFLGLGARPPIAEWGSMMSDARSLMTTSPWITFSPGIAIFVSVMIFNLLGDAVRDYADPKNRGR
jgi:peptide/nickel transport system permease protein